MRLPVRAMAQASGWGAPGLRLKRYLPKRTPARRCASVRAASQTAAEGSPLPRGPYPALRRSRSQRVSGRGSPIQFSGVSGVSQGSLRGLSGVSQGSVPNNRH
jgi:hypothetical protein